MLPFDYAVRNLGRSPRRTASMMAGTALVALIVLAAGGFVRGMRSSLTTSGRADNVILLGAGSEESAERSEIPVHAAGQAMASIGGLRRTGGVSHVSPEIQMAMLVSLSEGSADLPAVLRGITPAAFLVHDQVQIVDGRAPQAGRDEIIVGRLAATRLGVAAEELALGRTLWFGNRSWSIVGRFSAGGTVMDAEIWCPSTDLQIAARRDSLSCVVLTLDEAEFADVDTFCRRRLDLELVAIRERDYYAKLNAFYGPIRSMVWVTAGLIALGGLFGGLNTLYAAFAARVRELGMLQTLGFSRRAIVVSLVQEATVTTAVGSLVAAAVGAWCLDGLSVRFSMGAFGLRVDAAVMAMGLLAGLLLGVIGALPPAWRCLRLPIPDALRTA
ncbi:MAG: ABC transporter permease [Phycisphaerae bacterium]|nr:ABC transporter permease [Phycisphaerae bacterium]